MEQYKCNKCGRFFLVGYWHKGDIICPHEHCNSKDVEKVEDIV